jgi:6-phosphogluconolactonase
MTWIGIIGAAALVAGASFATAAEPAGTTASAGDSLVFIGTSPGSSDVGAVGIYVCRMNPSTGALSEPTLAAPAKRPSFLAQHPTLRVLYACDETSDNAGKKGGGVLSFSVEPATGKLAPMNQQMSGGLGPCFVEVDPTGGTLLVANYGSGSVASLPLDAATGKISPTASVDQHEGTGPDAKRQTGPHAHSFRVDPSGKFALSPDLGTDRVMVYQLDASAGKVTANDPPSASVAPGAGPRHLAFSKDGKFAYVSNEMGNTVTAFAWDSAKGTVSEIQTISTLPEGFSGTSYVAEVTVAPNGKFLYVSNRGHDTIAVFEIDPATGKLTTRGETPTGGNFPRHFAIDPTGKFMIVGNQNSGTLVVFAIDAQTGALKATGSTVKVPGPTCVRFWSAK